MLCKFTINHNLKILLSYAHHFPFFFVVLVIAATVIAVKIFDSLMWKLTSSMKCLKIAVGSFDFVFKIKVSASGQQ